MTLSLFAPPPRSCEGCNTPAPQPLIEGWTSCGTSTKRPKQIAVWCRTCTEQGSSTRYLHERLARIQQGKAPTTT